MIYTTLNKIRAHGPCADGWAKLLRHLGKTEADDEPLSLAVILDSNGFNDALWCLRAVDGHDREKRLFAVWCARRVQHLMRDPRSIQALDVAERHANGQATDAELAVARDAAWDAARAAWDAAWDAAWAAAWEAAWAAAWVAAGAAREAAGAAVAAAGDAAGDAAWDAERAAQEAEFRRVFCSAALRREETKDAENERLQAENERLRTASEKLFRKWANAAPYYQWPAEMFEMELVLYPPTREETNVHG